LAAKLNKYPFLTKDYKQINKISTDIGLLRYSKAIKHTILQNFNILYCYSTIKQTDIS